MFIHFLGWICYAEKTHPFVLPYISNVKSPQQIQGRLIKSYLAAKLDIAPSTIYHLSIMPCYDKKLEASRESFFEGGVRDVDCVISTLELDRLLSEKSLGRTFAEFAAKPLSPLFSNVNNTADFTIMYGAPGNASGGYLEYILRYASKELSKSQEDIDVPMKKGCSIKVIRNSDCREITVHLSDKETMTFAAVYGFRNIQNFIRKLKTGKCRYDYVEVMACPGGCINGGGQLRPDDQLMDNITEWTKRVNSKYSDDTVAPRYADENDHVSMLIHEWLGGWNTEIAMSSLKTSYKAVEPLSTVSALHTEW